MPLIARQYPFGEAKFQARMVDCYGKHGHEMLVISAVAGGGKLRFVFEDGSIPVGAETLMCFAPYQQHRAVVEGEVREYVILHLEQKWIVDVFGLDAAQVRWRRQLEDATLHGAFVKMVKRLALGEGQPEALEEWLWLYWAQSVEGVVEHTVPNQTLESIRQEIELKWNEPLTIESLAQKYDLNTYSLIRQFKRLFGATPKKYLLDLRVHRAKELIAGGMGIAEAALTCGFYDQSHLYNYFKKIFGVSPKVYQEAFGR